MEISSFARRRQRGHVTETPRRVETAPASAVCRAKSDEHDLQTKWSHSKMIASRRLRTGSRQIQHVESLGSGPGERGGGRRRSATSSLSLSVSDWAYDFAGPRLVRVERPWVATGVERRARFLGRPPESFRRSFLAAAFGESIRCCAGLPRRFLGARRLRGRRGGQFSHLSEMLCSIDIEPGGASKNAMNDFCVYVSYH